MTRMTIVCPQCGEEIHAVDIQPAADLALCRRCDETFRLSGLTGGARGKASGGGNVGGNARSRWETEPSRLAEPPKYITIENRSDGLNITYQRMNPLGFLVALFLAIPTIMLFLFFGISRIGAGMPGPLGFVTFQAIFSVILLIPLIFGSMVALFLLFGRIEIHLEPDGPQTGTIRVFTGVGPIGWTRRCSYNPETEISLQLFINTSRHHHGSGIHGSGIHTRSHTQIGYQISIQSGYDEIRFGTMIHNEATKKQLIMLIEEAIRS